MTAWRCSHCGTNWPFQGAYAKTCGSCGGDVWSSPGSDPIPVDEAQRRLAIAREDRKAEEARAEKRAKFERQYADREVAQAMAGFDAEWLAFTARRDEEAT